MIKSMTGYGNSRVEASGVTISAEVKSLNSKFLDVQIKLPKEFSDKELEVKSMVGEQLNRGKITVTVDYHDESTENSSRIDTEALIHYYEQVKSAADSKGEDSSGLLPSLLQLPDIIITEEQKLSDDEWSGVVEVIRQALDQCDEHRKDEGVRLTPALSENIAAIGAGLQQVGEEDPKRITAIKERIGSNLKEHLGGENIDSNRFEQEVIYFLEKLDITEEKVRLGSHLSYFTEVLASENSQGKKLGFITQEIGREINTIGSKANHAPIQHLVVGMKEELEKIREQLLNIL